MVRFAILRFGEEWRVVSDRRTIGAFDTSQHALELGVTMALEAAAAGHEVELLVQDAVGQLEARPIRLKPQPGDRSNRGLSS